MSQSDMFRSILGDKHLRILGVPEDKKIDHVEFVHYCTELERQGLIVPRRRQIYIDQAEHANKETKLYFTADTHFGQEDVIKALRRPFSSLSEMNDRLIRNWNEVVGPRDTVFHLGDFGAGKRNDLISIFDRLNGQKILIEGDQDSDSSLRLPWTDRKKAWRIIVNGQKLWLMHHPQHSWDGREQGTWHLHGHVHGEGNPLDLSLDVGVDCWDYRPVGFTEIQERMRLLGPGTTTGTREQEIADAQAASIEIACPSCGTAYRNVKPEQIGKVGRCRKCGHKFRVELKTDTPPPNAAPPQQAAVLSAQTQAHFGAAETVAASLASGKDVSPAKAPVKAPARTVYAKGPADSAVLRKAEHDVAADWNVGDIILDLYEVTDILGEGGMGKVYKVRHLGWDMDLAVKGPRKEYLAASGGTEDFIREAETWVNLGQHPNVVGCYYVRTLGEIPRLFAEYVEGGSLSDWIRTRKLYEGNTDEILARILDIGIQTAWGLHYAHEKGLVHQDMKPGNVMMTPDGLAKITDFGLARAKGSAGTTVSSPAEGKTMVVAAAGMYTPEYASPEQLTGSNLTRRADIWSWAASVVEMFAGGIRWSVGIAAGDFLNKNLANWSGLENAGPRPPGVVARILRKCFEVEPGDRPRSLSEIVAVLRDEYQQIMHKVYPRLEPTVKSETADSLNNRALSLMDLGKSEDALKLWDKALMIEPGHPLATYNRALIRWRSGRQEDLSVLNELEAVRELNQGDWLPTYLLGLIRMESGNYAIALELFESIAETATLHKEVEAAIYTARECEPKSNRMITEFQGHTKEVTSVSLSHDGRYALSGSSDTTIRLWDTGTGECLRTFKEHTWEVHSVSLSHDGRYALSGSWDATIKLWDTGTGECLRTFKEHSREVHSVSLSHDGRYALSGSSDRTLKLWDTGTGKCLHTLQGHNAAVTSVSLSHDGRYALSGSWDATIKLWDTGTGECLRTFKEHTREVHSVSLSHDGRYALSGSGDATVKLWDTGTGMCLRTFQGHRAAVNSVSLSHDARYALSGSDDRSLKLWDTTTGQCIYTGTTGTYLSVSLNFAFDKALFGGGERVSLWSIAVAVMPFSAPILLSHVSFGEETAYNAGNCEREIKEARSALDDGDIREAVRCLRGVRMHERFVRHPESMELWAQLTLKLPVRTFAAGWKQVSFQGHETAVTSVSLSHDGRYALSGSEDTTIKLWDTGTGECLRTFQGHESAVTSICLSHDGRYALSGGSWDRTLKLWDTGTGECLRTFQGHESAVTSICLSHDRRYALSGSWGSSYVQQGCLRQEDFVREYEKLRHCLALRLWDTGTGECLRTFEGHESTVTSVSLSHDGRYALSGSEDKTLRLWDTGTGECLRTFEGHESTVTSVSLSHDGRYALSGSSDRTLKLWDTGTGECIRTFQGHETAVTSVSLSHDGRYALSGSGDRTLKLWDAGTGKCLHTLQGHTDGVNPVCLSRDRTRVVSGDHHGIIIIWTLDWELEDRYPENWDEGARPYLEVFLTQHTLYAATLPQDREPTEDEITLALTRKGKPSWTEDDFKDLLYSLGCAGYGWLRPEGVRRKLEEMAAEWEGPPKLFE